MRSTLDMLHALRDLEDARLTAPHRLVLAMMLACREGDGERVQPDRRGASAPSVRSLVRATGLGESTIQRARGQLRAWGYLAVRHEGHHHAAPVYDLVLPERSQCETPRSETPRSEGEGSRSETRGSRCEGGGVSQRDHLRISSADPSEDHSADQHTSVEPLRLVIDGEQTKSEKPSKGKSATSADETLVYDAYLTEWRKVVGRGEEPKLLPSRRKQIQRLLRDGYTVARHARAFEGLFASAYHRGENATGTKYLEIEQVIRSAERLEKFESMPNVVTKSAVVRPAWGGIKQAIAPDELAPWRQEAKA